MPRELDLSTVRQTPRPRTEQDPATLAPGTVLANRYRILELLGKGGMGVVYRAFDRSLELDVAIKVLHPDIAHDPTRVAFFRNEVRTARKVTHGSVCRLHDLEESEDGTFITMEYIAGESLSRRLRREPMSLGDAVRVLREVAAGLAVAHAAGVIHRDLKPSNVLIAHDRVVVVDFGIATMSDDSNSDIAGTRGYMAPEQARGGALDARVDVYAFGVLACVLTTGVMPPPAHTHIDEGAAASTALPIADPTPSLAKLPRPLGQLIERCLARDPAARPADGGELVRALATIRLRRSRAWLAIALAACAVVAAVAFAFARRDAALPAVEPRVFVGAIDAGGLATNERWRGAALQRMIAHELADAWGIEAEAGVPANPARGTIAVHGSLAHDPSGRFRATIDGDRLEAATTRELAIAAAARIAGGVAPAFRHPTAQDLRDAGTQDVEAWRLWRRAQREGFLQRWYQVELLCKQASTRDPGFPLAMLELSFSRDNRDGSAGRELAEAQRLLAARPSVHEMWRIAALSTQQTRDGKFAEAEATRQRRFTLDLGPRERFYADIRTAMVPYYLGRAAETLPTLQKLVDEYPDDASASKLLAHFYVGSEVPTAHALALRYATRAVALAPEDAGARAELGLALLQNDKPDEARARAAELATMEPDDQRNALWRIFSLHMALGDPAEAEIDARRNLVGEFTAPIEGRCALSLLDLYWGRIDSGIDGVLACADALEAHGASEDAASERLTIARAALQLGRRDLAARVFARVASGDGKQAGLAAVLEQLARGRVDTARTLATKLAAGTAARIGAELSIAYAAKDLAGVVTANEQLAKVSTSREYDFMVADALERLHRPDEAALAFEHFARHPQAWYEPVSSVIAWYRLGVLREQLGDPAAARTAFAEVVKRWGGATVAIPEVAEARKHLARHK